MLRRIFGPKRNEVTGEWRTLHNEELNDLHSSPNIARVVKSRRKKSAGYVALLGEKCIQGFDGEIEGYERIILRWIFRKWDRLRIGTGVGLL